MRNWFLISYVYYVISARRRKAPNMVPISLGEHFEIDREHSRRSHYYKKNIILAPTIFPWEKSLLLFRPRANTTCAKILTDFGCLLSMFSLVFSRGGIFTKYSLHNFNERNKRVQSCNGCKTFFRHSSINIRVYKPCLFDGKCAVTMNGESIRTVEQFKNINSFQAHKKRCRFCRFSRWVDKSSKPNESSKHCLHRCSSASDVTYRLSDGEFEFIFVFVNRITVYVTTSNS